MPKIQDFTEAERGRIKQLKEQGYKPGGWNQIIARERQQNMQAQMAQVQANFEANLAQGMTPGQAATTQFSPAGQVRPEPPNFQYTVKDGDNLGSIAQNFGIDPQTFLSANPDLKHVQTGVVVQVPNANYRPPATSSINVRYPDNRYAGGMAALDRFYETIGLPVMYAEQPGAIPNAWGAPLPENAPWQQKFKRNLGYIPPIGIGYSWFKRFQDILNGGYK